MDQAELLGRLSRVKYLYTLAGEQQQKPEPLAGYAIVMLHDSIEQFCLLCAEHRGVKIPSDCRFMEYWKKLPLTHETTMSRMNKVRVNLKHAGVMPSKGDSFFFYLSAGDFFRDNGKALLSVDFDQVSLVGALVEGPAKSLLFEANDLIKRDRLFEALCKISLAFYQLLEEYEERRIDSHEQSPFDLLAASHHGMSYHWLRLKDGPYADLRDFIEGVEGSIKSLHEALRIIGFGIDWKNYIRFRTIVPSHARTMDGTVHFADSGEVYPIADEVKFALDFCVECGLALSESDFSHGCRRRIHEAKALLVREFHRVAEEILKTEQPSSSCWRLATDHYVFEIRTGTNRIRISFQEQDLLFPDDPNEKEERIRQLSNKVRNTLAEGLGDD